MIRHTIEDLICASKAMLVFFSEQHSHQIWAVHHFFKQLPGRFNFHEIAGGLCPHLVFAPSLGTTEVGVVVVVVVVLEKCPKLPGWGDDPMCWVPLGTVTGQIPSDWISEAQKRVSYSDIGYTQWGSQAIKVVHIATYRLQGFGRD